jgi:hypothetical protein
MAAGQHDVLGLDIAVHNALGMGVRQRVEHVLENPHRLRG